MTRSISARSRSCKRARDAEDVPVGIRRVGAVNAALAHLDVAVAVGRCPRPKKRPGSVVKADEAVRPFFRRSDLESTARRPTPATLGV